MLTPILIFSATYVVLAVGRMPGLRIDRTGAAIIGASLMVACNVLSLEEAYRVINFDTIILLFGMMIVVANLRLSGFFALVSNWVIEHAHRPLTLLAGIVAVAGVFSALFVNDTMCLVLTPLVLEITERLKRNPVPYLLAVAMASNAGSVATITGNPQNMMIGSFSGIHYRAFAAALAPVGLMSLVVIACVIVLFFRREFADEKPMPVAPHQVRIHPALLWKSVAISAGMIACFFAGVPVPKAAVVAGALLLITRRIKPERVYREIDWPLLVMFVGLFIVVAGMEKTPVAADLFAFASGFHLDRTGPLSVFCAALSNLVSNVPAVLVLKPFIAGLRDATHAWLAVAMSSTLAGNLTLLGSVANLIVIQRARSTVHIGFWEYARVGIPVTVITIGLGVLWLG